MAHVVARAQASYLRRATGSLWSLTAAKDDPEARGVKNQGVFLCTLRFVPLGVDP